MAPVPKGRTGSAKSLPARPSGWSVDVRRPQLQSTDTDSHQPGSREETLVPVPHSACLPSACFGVKLPKPILEHSPPPDPI